MPLEDITYNTYTDVKGEEFLVGSGQLFDEPGNTIGRAIYVSPRNYRKIVAFMSQHVIDRNTLFANKDHTDLGGVVVYENNQEHLLHSDVIVSIDKPKTKHHDIGQFT